MLCGDDGALLARGGEHCAAGEDAGSPEYPSRALVKRRNGVVGKELGLSAGDVEMMGDIGGNVIALEGGEVAAAHDARSEGPGSVEEELVDEGGLSREDHGEEGSGVGVDLGEGMELGEDIEAEVVSFVDDKDRDLLLGGEVGEHGADYCEGAVDGA